MSDEVFIKGRVFPSLDEALEFERAWPDMEFDRKEFEYFMDSRMQEWTRNAEMWKRLGRTFTNRDAFQTLLMAIPRFLPKQNKDS